MLMWIPIISPIEVTLSAVPPGSSVHDDTIEDAEYTVHEEPRAIECRSADSRSAAEVNKQRSAGDWSSRLASIRKQLKGDSGENPEG
jgi:hypothetical protein